MWFLPVMLLFSAAQGLERRLSLSKNTGCDKLNMYHLKAEGPNDTLHYIWDFTENTKPSIFLALTEANDTVYLNCNDFAHRTNPHETFNFTTAPKYEFFLTINELIEFNDVNDTGILTPQTPRISYDLKHFSWAVSEGPNEDKMGRFVSLKMTGTGYNNSESYLLGNFSVQLTAFGFENHDEELPRMLHSPNSTQCKITLENLTSNSEFSKSRYAIQFIMVSSDRNDTSSKITTRKNLDDENSPGIFSMVDVMTPKSQDQLFAGAFMQWRPVLYTSKVPSLANSSETMVYNLTKVTNPEVTLADSLPFFYYGNGLESVLVEQTTVSLGATQDGFYRSSNFTSWTFLLNYGSPEEEKFSLLVILVMCIGLGLPALLILIGGSYMCARRIRRSKDELSLER